MITFGHVRDLIDGTPDWTRSVRQLRMAEGTAGSLVLLAEGWEYPWDSLYGYPVVFDDSVPYGTVLFEIPVPEPTRGLV